MEKILLTVTETLKGEGFMWSAIEEPTAAPHTRTRFSISPTLPSFSPLILEKGGVRYECN